MSTMFKNPLFPFSLAMAVLASGAAGGADTSSVDSIDIKQPREIVWAQDQTQYRNRDQLEKRINGSDTRNRYRYRQQEQTRRAKQTRTNRGQRAYGAGASPVARPQGSSAAGSGRRMMGSGDRRYR